MTFSQEIFGKNSLRVEINFATKSFTKIGFDIKQQILPLMQKINTHSMGGVYSQVVILIPSNMESIFSAVIETRATQYGWREQLDSNPDPRVIMTSYVCTGCDVKFHPIWRLLSQPLQKLVPPSMDGVNSQIAILTQGL